MPREGYTTIDIKPATSKKLQKMTELMQTAFVPTTLIMLMNEIRNEKYDIRLYRFSSELPGNYTSLTIRVDVTDWLWEKFREFGKEYEKKYNVKHFTKFVNYFILNVIESKIDYENKSINLIDSNFNWLQKEYQKHEMNLTFENFANVYLNNLFSDIDKQKI